MRYGPAGAIGFPAHRKIIEELGLKRQQRSRPHGAGGTDYPPSLSSFVQSAVFEVDVFKIVARERESGRWSYVLLSALGERELAI